MDATNSSTVTRFLRNPMIKAYKQLTKFYGVNADIYKLLTQDRPASELHGFMDDLQNYERQPYYSGKVLIPSLFRRRQSTNLAVLDPFVDSDQYLYIPADREVLLNSLVVCRLKTGRILNFRVSEISNISNEAGEIINRHSLVPVTSMDILRNTNEIKKQLKKELEDWKAGKLNNGSTTQPNFNAGNGMHYEPIN